MVPHAVLGRSPDQDNKGPAMIAAIKRLFGHLTPLEIASRELAGAELERLAAYSAAEYASSVIDYNNRRIGRLRSFIAVEAADSSKETAS